MAVVGVPGSGAAAVAAAVADATLARLIRAEVPLSIAFEAGTTTTILETVAAWRRPLVMEAWENDPHGTIADYWLDALPEIADEQLGPDQWRGFAEEYEQLVGHVVAPHVAIFLRLDRDEMHQRLAFRGGKAAIHSDVFADLPVVPAEKTAEKAAALLRLQDRLERRLRCPDSRCPRSPKAVITIDAANLVTAIAEATAAVEAML